MLKLNDSLGRFSARDMDRLNHASEILAALHITINQTSISGKGAMAQLCFEANQEILAVLAKPAGNMKRWLERDAARKAETNNGGSSSETV
jgi:hypothetical protein